MIPHFNSLHDYMTNSTVWLKVGSRGRSISPEPIVETNFHTQPGRWLAATVWGMNHYRVGHADEFYSLSAGRITYEIPVRYNRDNPTLTEIKPGDVIVVRNWFLRKGNKLDLVGLPQF